MIKLKGEVRLKRLYGEINLVPSSAGGGPLQAKTVYPSHERQIITPDEDYYGLVSVVAEPVPRLPSFETVFEAPSGVEYYYNHEQLPEIPADVIENYPYIVIYNNFVGGFRVFATKAKPYFDGTSRLQDPEGGTVRYNHDTAVDEWLINQYNPNSNYFDIHGKSYWAVWWSNFDIPNGSPDSTEIYWPASEPTEEKPSDATHFYYNGIRRLELPQDVLATHPYAVFFERNGNRELVFGKGAWYVNNSNQIWNSVDSDLQWYGAGKADSGQEGWSFYKVTNGYWDNPTVLWANHDVKKGSATATEIYFYGTHAVPDPV